jgi:metal-dependent amidase/aminoacylase/carboxypeptidase family protein
MTTIDTTLVASHIVIALQSIASRNVDPTGEVVVSVTSFPHGFGGTYVIPETVRLRGTVRSHDAAIRDLAERRLAEIAG